LAHIGKGVTEQDGFPVIKAVHLSQLCILAGKSALRLMLSLLVLGQAGVLADIGRIPPRQFSKQEATWLQLSHTPRDDQGGRG